MLGSGKFYPLSLFCNSVVINQYIRTLPQCIFYLVSFYYFSSLSFLLILILLSFYFLFFIYFSSLWFAARYYCETETENIERSLVRVQSYLNNSKNIVTEKAKEFSALWNISSIVKLVIFNIYSVNNFKSEDRKSVV